MFRIILFSLVVLATLAVLNVSDKGIIGLEGWAHGVAMCEGTEDVSITKIGRGYTWTQGGIFYTVNEGHMNDPQVLELETKAKELCKSFF